MALELYMVGLIVRDMPAAVAFYRRLGVEIPERAEQQVHVEVKMGNMTFFLDSRPDRWDPGLDSPPPEVPAPSATDGRYPMVLEFYLKAQAALEAKYLEMVDAGYHGFRAPYATTFGMCFAMLKDPDGNTVLLSADATPAEAASG
jgi:catechol 2,3-dioxygenase-like lactoylglutathione lyase family enzyme